MLSPILRRVPTRGRRRAHHRERDERGAVAIFVAAIMVLLVLSSSFVVDIGMQRVLRRDLQGLADIAALDLARLLDGRPASVVIAGDAEHRPLALARDDVLARNHDVLGDPPHLDVALVRLASDGSVVTDAGGAPVRLTGSEVPDAVWVRATGQVPFAFHPGAGGGARTAVGVADDGACLQVGSFAAALSTSTSPILIRYLGDALDVSAVGYDGLADSRVTLGSLAAALGVGSTRSIVDLQNLSLGTLFSATATALRADGGQEADALLLQTMATRVSGSLRADLTRFVDLTSGSSAVLAGTINVLDLVSMSAFLANGDHLLDLPVLWSVPQFSQGATSLTLIEGPQRACGGTGDTVAQTAQLRLSATPTLNVPTIAGLSAAPVTVDLLADLAAASATLTGVDCGAGTAASPIRIRARVEHRLSSVRLSIPIRLQGSIKASNLLLGQTLLNLLGGLGLNTKATFDLRIEAGVTLTSPASTVDATYAVPPHAWTDPERVGGTGGWVIPHVSIDGTDISGSATVTGLLGTTTTLNLAGLVLGTQLDLSPVINDLVQKNVIPGIDQFIDLVNTQLTPLTQLLGLQVSGADLFGVEKPGCSVPTIRG